MCFCLLVKIFAMYDVKADALMIRFVNWFKMKYRQQRTLSNLTKNLTFLAPLDHLTT